MTSTVRAFATRALLLAGCMLAFPAVAAADLTWSGQGTAPAWSESANWVGADAPGTNAGALSFPNLGACSHPDTCYASNNDNLLGVNATGLSIDDSVGYELTGYSIVLGSHGITAAPGGSVSGQSPFSAIFAPIVLGTAQTWSIAGTGSPNSGVGLVLGGVSGAPALNVTVRQAGLLNFAGYAEVGPTTITGADLRTTGSAAGSNGGVYVESFGGASSLNATDGNPIRVRAAEVAAVAGSTIGPLTLSGGLLLAQTSGAGPGPLVVNGALTLDARSAASFEISQDGTTPGTDYAQVSTTGAVSLGGARLAIDASACPTLTQGNNLTVITSKGNLNGTFAGLPQGATLQPCAGETFQVNYTPHGVILTVVSSTVPLDQTAPTTSGHARQGRTLKASPGAWQNAPTAFRYQWLDCNRAGLACTAISGAGGIRYTVRRRDAGHRIVVEVLASNASGEAAAASRPTAVVARRRAKTHHHRPHRH